MDNRVFLVDWLSFTVFKNEKSTQVALMRFKNEFPFWDYLVEEVKPLFGYTHGWQLGKSGISWYAHMDRADMGIHVIVSGSNMPMLIDRLLINPNQDDYVLASKILQEIRDIDSDFSVSRIDLAFDDYKKIYKPYDYMVFYSKQRLSLQGSMTAPSFTHCSPDGGGTAYFGSRVARRELRIYDKFVESMGHIDAIRYEAELHREYAMRAVNVIMSGDPYDFSALVQMFVVLYNDVGYEEGLLLSRDAWNKRRKRAGVDEKFASLFSGLTKSAIFKVPTSSKEYKLDRKLAHLQSNVAPQILLMVDVCNGDWDFVLDLIKGQSYSDRQLRQYEILHAEYEQITMGQALRP